LGKEFVRLRVGIGHPGNSRDVTNYVLGRAAADEQAAIEQALQEAMLDHVRNQLRAVGRTYFGLNLPCPFLQNQSCSIHPQRPLSCREFLVVSNPKYCSEPDPEVVETVVLPKRVSPILYDLCRDESKNDEGFISLVQLVESVGSVKGGQPDPAPARVWLERFLQRLGGA
jgi:Fe-S-cluster containining protein